MGQETPVAAAGPTIASLEAMFDRAAHARQPQDVDWVLNAAFFVGKHYTDWDDKSKRFYTIPRPAGRPLSPRPVANKIYSLTMDSYASAKAHDPEIEVLPTTSDAIDISNAKVAQALLEDLASPSKCAWETRRNQALFWAALMGEGYLKWTMDTDKRRPRIEACSPLEIYGDPTPASYLDWRWVIHTRGMDPEDVYDRFNVEVEGSDTDSADVLKMKVLREIGMVTGNPTVTVKELWELPSRRHEKGRHIIWAAGKVLLNESFPYKHGQLPYAQIGHSPIPGTAHFMCGVHVARPLNMELNQFHAQKITSRKKFNNFKWFIESGMVESLNALPDDSDDQVMIGDTQSGRLPVPTILQAQPWPDSGDGEWINEELQNAIGLHDASMGQAPGRVDSAAGIEKLQEADRGRLSEVEDTLNVAISRGFAQALSLMKQYVPEELMVPVYHPNGAVQVHRFKTENLPDEPLMRVVNGGGLPKNRAARRQEVMSMFAAGLFGTPDDPKAASRAMQQLGYATDMNLSGEELDEMEAMAENLLMLSGQAASPKPWQNHEVHRRIHNECRKSAEFASSTTEVWNIFEMHEGQTDVAELDEMKEEAQRQKHIQDMLETVYPPEAAPEPAVGPDGAPLPPGAGAPAPDAGAPPAAADPGLMAAEAPITDQSQPEGQGLTEEPPV